MSNNVRLSRRPIMATAAVVAAAAATVLLCALDSLVPAQASHEASNFCTPAARAGLRNSIMRQGCHATSTKSPKAGQKYRGAVNPKLRALISAPEYREMIGTLALLKDNGVLKNFLQNAENYWEELDVIKLAAEEAEGKGDNIIQRLKREWPRIWPTALDDYRVSGCDKFVKFWSRLGQSKVVDNVLVDVLPNMKAGYQEMMKSADQKKLMEMNDEDRSAELYRRLGDSPIVKQYVILSENDAEVKQVADEVAPFLARAVVILERKLATQTASLDNTATFAVIGFAVLVTLFALVLNNYIKLPDFSEGGDLPPPPPTKPTRVIKNADGTFTLEKPEVAQIDFYSTRRS